MGKILILAKSGFGKSTSIGEIPELGLKGLDPKTTYLISCVNKPLPFRGANKKFVVTTTNNPTGGNRVITNDAEAVAKIINMLAKSPYKNIVLDDMNYMAQDYYMKKALKGDVKAFEVLRDTAGEKPIDKVMVADVDQSVIDEVEEMVKGEPD